MLILNVSVFLRCEKSRVQGLGVRVWKFYFQEMVMDIKSYIVSAAMFCLLMGGAVQGEEAAMSEQEAIKKYRMGTIKVYGEPGDVVKVTQLRHEFMFGTAIASHMFKDKVEVQHSFSDFLKSISTEAAQEQLVTGDGTINVEFEELVPIGKGS